MLPAAKPDLLATLPEEVQLLRVLEVLKEIDRQNPIGIAERRERVAEHSWHLALAVILLAANSSEQIDVAKAAVLAIIHDIAEAYVGDTFAFGSTVDGQKAREQNAMRALQEGSTSSAANLLVELWNEYEEQETAEARFVKGLDAFLPILLNYSNAQHSSWIQHGVRAEQVKKRLDRVRGSIGALAWMNDSMIEQAKSDGFLK